MFMEFNEILDSFKDVGIGSLIVSFLTFIFWILEKTIVIPNVVSKIFYMVVYSKLALLRLFFKSALKGEITLL